MSAITSDERFATVPPHAGMHVEGITPFTTSSRDPQLLKLAASHAALIACSSSSTVPVLSRLYMAQVGDAKVDLSDLSIAFASQSCNMTKRVRAPMSAILRRRRLRDGVVQQRLLSLEEVEAGKQLGDDSSLDGEGVVSVWGMDCGYRSEDAKREPILLKLGHSLEAMFTMEEDEFHARYPHSAHNSAQQQQQQHQQHAPHTPRSLAYLFTLANRTLMRSQLDCYDPRLLAAAPSSEPPSALAHSSTPPSSTSPSSSTSLTQPAATGAVFDIKTRAVAPIRYDVTAYEKYLDYRISQPKGLLNSYEREWYDMARAVFLKFALQCRMGRMAGIMVAYHNTQSIFGMEMIRTSQMERVLLGEHALTMAPRLFEMSLRMLDEVTCRVVELVQALYSGRYAESIQLVVGQSEDDPSQVDMFAELLPPPADDFDSHLPFTHRHATLYRLDQLDLPSLQRVAEAHALEVQEGQTRNELLLQLETLLLGSTTRYLPPIPHLARLIQRNLLVKLSLKVEQRAADGRRLSVGQWRTMSAEEVAGVQSGYSLHVVNTAEMSAREQMRVAWEYSKMLEIGYMLERQEAKLTDVLEEVEGDTSEQASPASASGRRRVHHRKQPRRTPPTHNTPSASTTTSEQWADGEAADHIDGRL